LQSREACVQDGVALSLKSNDSAALLNNTDANANAAAAETKDVNTGAATSNQSTNAYQHIELQFTDANANYYCKVVIYSSV
jgi:hypothetical protein